MSITHEQARTLVQFNLDRDLQPAETAALSAHLRDCTSCSAYAYELKEVVTILKPALSRKWNAAPIPLSGRARLQRKGGRIDHRIMLTTRTAGVIVAVLVLFFSAWQFALFSDTRVPNEIPLVVLPVPTPSSQLASVRLTYEACEITFYTVNDTDTLASLANRFSLSEAELRAINGLETNTWHPGMELMIPICTATPTEATQAGTFTTTYTPWLGVRTSTPGPSG